MAESSSPVPTPAETAKLVADIHAAIARSRRAREERAVRPRSGRLVQRCAALVAGLQLAHMVPLTPDRVAFLVMTLAIIPLGAWITRQELQELQLPPRAGSAGRAPGSTRSA
jgi:hypothetical protein